MRAISSSCSVSLSLPDDRRGHAMRPRSLSCWRKRPTSSDERTDEALQAIIERRRESVTIEAKADARLRRTRRLWWRMCSSVDVS